MSVETTADEQIVFIKEHIDTAIEILSDIIIKRVWGWEDFNKEYQNDLKDTLNQLLDIRDSF